MTFQTVETSRSLAEPDTLFRFQVGDTVYAYTDAEQPRTFNGVTYTPIPIDRDQVSASSSLDKTTMKIRVPVTTEIAELFRIYPPSEVVTVTVFQGHAFEDEFKAVWSGRVLSCSRDHSQAEMACEPVSTSMKRPGLRRRYQRGCPHVLYGDRCRVDRPTFTRATTVSVVDGAYLTLPGGWNGVFDPQRFAGGIFVGGDATRAILSVTGNVMLVGGAVAGLVSGAAVSLSLGCAHTMDACNGFANILNYGGQPWIPTQNPISTSSQFY